MDVYPQPLPYHREKAVFAVEAHIFQIDQQTKKRWLPSSIAAVRVAYYHDPGRKTFRIIAIENSKVCSPGQLLGAVSPSCCRLGEIVGGFFRLLIVLLILAKGS